MTVVFLLWESHAEKGDGPELHAVYESREAAEQALETFVANGWDEEVLGIDEQEVLRKRRTS